MVCRGIFIKQIPVVPRRVEGVEEETLQTISVVLKRRRGAFFLLARPSMDLGLYFWRDEPYTLSRRPSDAVFGPM